MPIRNFRPSNWKRCACVASAKARTVTHGGRTHAVFADISQRATDLLAAELREAGVTAEVAVEMDRILQRLLISFERVFAQP